MSSAPSSEMKQVATAMYCEGCMVQVTETGSVMVPGVSGEKVGNIFGAKCTRSANGTGGHKMVPLAVSPDLQQAASRQLYYALTVNTCKRSAREIEDKSDEPPRKKSRLNAEETDEAESDKDSNTNSNNKNKKEKKKKSSKAKKKKKQKKDEIRLKCEECDFETDLNLGGWQTERSVEFDDLMGSLIETTVYRVRDKYDKDIWYYIMNGAGLKRDYKIICEQCMEKHDDDDPHPLDVYKCDICETRCADYDNFDSVFQAVHFDKDGGRVRVDDDIEEMEGELDRYAPIHYTWFLCGSCMCSFA